MWDHIVSSHGGNLNINPQDDIKFTVITTYRDPLTRQIAEAAKIQRAMDTNTFQSQGGDVIKVNSMNRKSEHFAPLQRRQDCS